VISIGLRTRKKTRFIKKQTTSSLLDLLNQTRAEKIVFKACFTLLRRSKYNQKKESKKAEAKTAAPDGVALMKTLFVRGGV